MHFFYDSKGPLLGDRGSGFDIGQQICISVLAAHDQRIPPTLLTHHLLDFLKLNSAEQLIGFAYLQDPASWEKWANLAPLAAECAKKGDETAKQILKQAASALATHIRHVENRLGLSQHPPFPIALCGGNLAHEGSLLAEYLANMLKETYADKAEIRFPKVDPAEAAALVALNKLK